MEAWYNTTMNADKTWTWRWVGGGLEATTAATREEAWLKAVRLGCALGTRGTVLTPDLPTLTVQTCTKKG